MEISRRSALAAGASFALASIPVAAKPTKHPLGAQLYTLRAFLPDRIGPVLKRLAEAGYKELETLRVSNPISLPLCKDFGLNPVSCHFETGLFNGNAKVWNLPAELTLDKALEDAAKAGQKYIVVPYIRPDERGGLDVVKKLAAQINQAGEKVHKAGLQLCYHNHAFEFATIDGQRPMDVLLKETDAKTMGIELDLFWAAVAGEDPVATLRAWKGRVKLVHLKDKAPGLKTQFTEAVPPAAFREVGFGVLDFKAILKACAETGVEHYFVEQDQVPGDPIDSLKASYDHLVKLGF